MTNSETIEILEMERIFRNGSNSKVEAIDIALSALKENTKLKAEIEQLKNVSEINSRLVRINEKQNREIKELKLKLKKCNLFKIAEELRETTPYNTQFEKGFHSAIDEMESYGWSE